MKTMLDAHGETRRRLVQAAAAVAVMPPVALVVADAGATAPAQVSGDGLEVLSSGRLRVSGRVVDADDVPLAGWRVVLLDAQRRVAGHDRCDADGRFLLSTTGDKGLLRIELDGARTVCTGDATVMTDGDGILRCAVRLRAGSALRRASLEQ